MNSTLITVKGTIRNMSQNVEDVVSPEALEDGIETSQPTPLRTKLLILCLVTMQLLLIAIIVFLLYFTQSCSSLNERKESGASLPGKENAFGTTDLPRRNTEGIPQIDLRMGKTSSETTERDAEPEFEKLTCKNPDCLHTAAHMMNSIDFTQQPCENFYDYACGRNDDEREEPLDIFAPKYLMGKDKPQFLKKFRRFYESCLTHEDKFDYGTRVQNTKSLLERVGTIRLNKKGNMEFNLTKFIADMILYDSMPLFDVDIDVNPTDSTYILKLMLPDQTSISLGHWSSLSETKRKCLRETENMSYGKELNVTLLYNTFLLCQKNYADYLDSISTSMQELGFFTNLTENEIYGQIRDIRIFIEFEILSKFDEIPLPPNLQELNIKRNHVNLKVGQLEKKFPMIQWELLFEILTNKSINNETVIQLYNQEYFEDVFRELSAEKNSYLNNAFLALLANSLYENTVLPSHRHTREEYCKEQSKTLMPDIVNYLYKVIVNPEVVQKKNKIMRDMFHNLKTRFLNSLGEQKWMDDASKASITQKLNNLKLLLFETDNSDAEKIHLELTYQPLDILKDEYQHNHFDLIEFRRRQFLSLYGEKLTPENMYRHFVDATKEEPVFFYPSNLICVPFGLSKHIRDDLPQYLIESRVGFALAKIIGHSFDRIGMHYGVNLTESFKYTYKDFAEETKDMLLLTNPISFGKKLLYFNLNNDLSESDRIAENTAMKLVTENLPSFQNLDLLPLIPPHFTREKIFFLHLVQGFCRKMKVTDFMVDAYESPVLPPQLRVANFLGNSGEFLKTFGCKPGSGMARIEESLQFPYLS
ncbi:neprilysin-11-like [Coccinella septempunctata]|uniref:neprilysin-11-like n=1 Tax=Coccinella septempunctata TaxID=41139 RepID=UPI001D05E0DD|nr:neprilysin-11-like [Coccinella septempunctata]